MYVDVNSTRLHALSKTRSIDRKKFDLYNVNCPGILQQSVHFVSFHVLNSVYTEIRTDITTRLFIH